METLQSELLSGLPDLHQILRITLRLTAAVAFGAIVGYERERTGKAAGLRTHMLVALSCAVFVLAPAESGMDLGDLSRVVQGVATGIGFIGAGAILKDVTEGQIKGLTTAAGLWMTAAAGVSAGLGRLGLAAISVLLAWVILALARRLD